MELNKNYFIIGFICLALGASLSLFKKPIIETKEVVKIEYKEVEKKDIKKDTHTKIKETKLPDGTVIKETEVINKDSVKIETDKNIVSKTEKSVSQKIINNHRFQLLEKANKSLDLSTHFNYTYKAYNPLFIKGEIDTKLNYTLEVGIELEF